MTEKNRHILFKLKPALQGDQVADAVDIEQSNTGQNGLLATATTQQEVNNRLDGTGLGAQPISFTGSFFCSYGELGNQGQWSGGRQNVEMVGARGQANGQYTFEVPDPSELSSMFDDLTAANLPTVYTLTIGYQGGSTSSVVRNSLTVRRPSVSVGGFIQTTLSQNTSVTYRIERIGGTINSWERLGVQQSTAPVATFGEVVLQNISWNNNNNSFLPPSGSVQKGYAFPVINSNPNDGTLRQGLIDSGVSDREIFDGDYVIWTADTFTAWTNGDDWFVLNRDDLQRMSREQSNFLAQTSEIDNRVDLGFVQMMASDALVWISENPLTAAPFLTPSGDPQNPRSGDDYAYIGGQEDRNAQQLFQFGQNRFNSFLTVGITPGFITGHPESTIDIVVFNDSLQEIERLNLANDFTFRDDGDFTNSTVRHYTRNTTFNYAFLSVVAVVVTQVQRHFTINPDTVNLTPNVTDLTEDQLSSGVQEKLNRALPPPDTDFSSIEDRLMTRGTTSISEPDIHARFLSASATGSYPQDLSQFNSVSVDNPRFQASDVVLFVATPEPGNFALMNTTADTIIALDQSEATVDIIESLSLSGVTYFVYRVTSIVSGNRYEVQRVTTEDIIVERNNITNLQSDVVRIDAELNHAALDLSDALIDVLDNNVSVTEESAPTINPTEYNNQLAGQNNATQTVFYETNPNAPSAGTLNSKPIKDTTGNRARRKLIYLDPQTFNNQTYLTAFDGAAGRDLIRYVDGQFSARQFVPAIPASTVVNTIYPAPSNKVSGEGIWINVPALTFVNGIPSPLADEVFFTRNVPATNIPVNVQYRGHANGNVFGTSSTTLAANQDSITFILDDSSEQATVEVLRRDGEIRVSVTERVNTGLPTINDIEVILSYDETRAVPATNSRTRDVPFESVTPRGQVFAIKPSDTGDLILVGSNLEVNTGFSYTTLFGASESGHLILSSELGEFLDYQDFEPIASTIVDLENHSSLTQRGLFTTEYTSATVVTFDTQLHASDSAGNAVKLGEELILVDTDDGQRYSITIDKGIITPVLIP